MLGDSFLRAAYVVFDQDNRNLHLAQAANCGTNVVAISSGKHAVPSLSGDCTATAAASTTTGTLTETQASSTITGDVNVLALAGTKSSQSHCSSCKTTATGTASPSSTKVNANAASKKTGSHLAAVGAFALAAWIV